MPYKARTITLLAVSWILVALLSSASGEVYDQVFNLPPLPPPEEFGNLLINRTSTSKSLKPVTFSHWLHRQKYTCRVCHTELGFNMQTNTTEITEDDNKSGRYCGACHNGVIAFRTLGNCGRCHNGNIAYSANKFSEFMKRPFPTAPYGNGINWVESVKEGMITPAHFLKQRSKELPFDKTLILESDWTIIPPSIFPHKAHTQWLDCNSCHPEIFNIKKKTTKHFSMAAILEGKFCGVCHLNVAFPMNDCKRCHPGITE